VIDTKIQDVKKKIKESMSDMEMFVPSNIVSTRKNSRNELEVQIVWALFEDEPDSFSWESVKELPDWFLKENHNRIYGK